jgi:hypothetical protein
MNPAIYAAVAANNLTQGNGFFPHWAILIILAIGIITIAFSLYCFIIDIIEAHQMKKLDEQWDKEIREKYLK